MKSVPANTLLSRDPLHQLPWSTECPPVHPELPSGRVEGQRLQQRGVPPPQRRAAKARVAVQSLAKALGKCQFVVDSLPDHLFILLYKLVGYSLVLDCFLHHKLNYLFLIG